MKLQYWMENLEDTIKYILYIAIYAKKSLSFLWRTTSVELMVWCTTFSLLHTWGKQISQWPSISTFILQLFLTVISLDKLIWKHLLNTVFPLPPQKKTFFFILIQKIVQVCFYQCIFLRTQSVGTLSTNL